MGQSFYKPIDLSENPTESEQLENVDERRNLVEMRSEDSQVYQDVLIRVIEQNIDLEDRINDLMNCIEELKTDNALMVTQIDNHNANSQLRKNKKADDPDNGIAIRNSLSSEYSVKEEKSSCVESPTEESPKSLQLLLATLTAKMEIGFKKLDSLVLSDKSCTSRPPPPPPPPPPLPPQETTRAQLNIVQRSKSVGGSGQCVEISVQEALIAEIKKKFNLRRVRERQINQNLSNMVEREVASEPNKKIS